MLERRFTERVTEVVQIGFYAVWDTITNTVPEAWNDQVTRRIAASSGTLALAKSVVKDFTYRRDVPSTTSSEQYME